MSRFYKPGILKKGFLGVHGYHSPPCDIVKIKRIEPHPIKATSIGEGVAILVIVISIARVCQEEDIVPGIAHVAIIVSDSNCPVAAAEIDPFDQGRPFLA
jgi:hypothetical protein